MRLCKCGCGNPIILQKHHRWKPSQYIWGHYLRGERNNHYKGVDKWVKEQQGKHHCHCPKCLEKGKCKETEIIVRPEHHWPKKGIPKYKLHHQTWTKKDCKRHSELIKKLYRERPEYREKLRRYNRRLIKQGLWGNRFKKRPTKPEKIFDSITPKSIYYVGNGSFWIRLKNGQCKNPDFKVKSQSKIIEIFGNWHHKNDNPKLLIKQYGQRKIKCLIIWEKEIYKDKKKVLKKVSIFLNS